MSFLSKHVRLRKHRFKFHVPSHKISDTYDTLIEKHEEESEAGGDDGCADEDDANMEPDTDDSKNSSTVDEKTNAQQQQQQQPPQQVYAKFKVVNGNYTQVLGGGQTILTCSTATDDGNNATMTVNNKPTTAATSQTVTSVSATHQQHVQHAGMQGQEYIIINSNECATMPGVEEQDVIMQHLEDEDEADEEEEEVEEDLHDEAMQNHEEYITNSPSRQQQQQQHLTYHHSGGQEVKSNVQRLILTAPRDGNTPSPTHEQQQQQYIVHQSQPQQPTQMSKLVPVVDQSSHHQAQQLVISAVSHATNTMKTTGGTQKGTHRRSNVSSGGEAVALGNVSDVQQHQTMLPFDEHEMFGQAVAASLRSMNRLHTIKAKVEIYGVLEKFVEMEEAAAGR